MGFTKKQAIAKHREIWHWIADEMERIGSFVSNFDYAKTHGFTKDNGCTGRDIYNIIHPLCTYSMMRAKKDGGFFDCGYCPINWGGQATIPCIDQDADLRYMFHDDKGLLSVYARAGNIEQSIQIARQIAELPVKKI